MGKTIRALAAAALSLGAVIGASGLASATGGQQEGAGTPTGAQTAASQEAPATVVAPAGNEAPASGGAEASDQADAEAAQSGPGAPADEEKTYKPKTTDKAGYAEAIKDAQDDAAYYCAEGTEYYDMAKCADAIERAGDAYKPDAGPQNPDEGEGPQSGGATADPAPQSGSSSAPAPSGSAGAGPLATTGAVAAVVVGAAGALAAAGAGLVALRKRA